MPCHSGKLAEKRKIKREVVEKLYLDLFDSVSEN